MAAQFQRDLLHRARAVTHEPLAHCGRTGEAEFAHQWIAGHLLADLGRRPGDSGTTGDVRQSFKMEYLEAIKDYLGHLHTDHPNIIISGDFNIAHTPDDINHPERHKKTSGFLPEERAWMDELISSGYTDTFREFDKRAGQYSWWSYRANSRAKNLGWRIDYHFITNSLMHRLKGAGIMQNVVHSDHCPVWIDLLMSLQPA